MQVVVPYKNASFVFQPRVSRDPIDACGMDAETHLAAVSISHHQNFEGKGPAKTMTSARKQPPCRAYSPC